MGLAECATIAGTARSRQEGNTMGEPTGDRRGRDHRRDRVAVIAFNRPERRNALHHGMFDPITQALEEFAVDDRVGCIVLTGAGSAFCAGGDVTGEGASWRRPR
jgi:2-(1,2-epoxy-1,2-dihydrophenyl)acetyl-CoA isomerase